MRPQFSSSHLLFSLLLLTGCDATPGRVGVVGPAPSDAAPPARDAGLDAAPTRDAGRRPPPDASEPDAGPPPAGDASTSFDAGSDSSTPPPPPPPPPECTGDADCGTCEVCSGGSCVPRTSLDVRRGAIADHGDASVSGSLAAVLTCAGPGDTVRLVDAGAYVTESQIRLPARVTLAGTSGAILRAGRGVMGRALVLVADGVTVRDLALDGGRNAHHLLQGGGVSDVSVLRSHLYDTRNAYPSGSNPRCHGLVLTASTRVTIRDNTIERIGYPKVSGTSWSGVCAGMYLERARTLNVHDNTVRDVLTAGIDFTGTLGAQITGNRIEDNGRNRAYGGPVADGITAYHNGHGFTYQDIWVTGNTILRSGNHGIHLSGRDVHIERNVIRDPWAQGILVMDQYTPHDCASNVTVHDNTISGIGSTGNRHAVYVGDDYKVGGVSVRGNGPDVYWKPGTTCT